MPKENQGYFTVELELPEGATIERTREVTRRALNFLMQDPDVDHVLDVVGSSPRVGTNQARSQLTVILKPWDERKAQDMNEVMNRARAEFAKYPEAKAFISTPPVIPGLGSCGVAIRRCQEPKLNLPQEIVEGELDSLSIADMNWWEFYGDEVLSGFISHALENNKDILIASTRIEQLRELNRVSRAALQVARWRLARVAPRREGDS